jgi:hypothetical protein
MTICQQVHIHSLILHIDSFIYLNKSQVYKCHMYTYAQSTRIYTCMCKPPLIIQNIPRGSRVATSGQARPYTWQCDIRSQLGSWQLSLPQLEAIPAASAQAQVPLGSSPQLHNEPTWKAWSVIKLDFRFHFLSPSSCLTRFKPPKCRSIPSLLLMALSLPSQLFAYCHRANLWKQVRPGHSSLHPPGAPASLGVKVQDLITTPQGPAAYVSQETHPHIETIACKCLNDFQMQSVHWAFIKKAV